MSDNDNCNSDSSPEASEKRWNREMTSVFAEVNRLRETLEEKDREIAKLQREIHKLKSVIEKSELRRIPSISSSSSHVSSCHHKKCGVSGESSAWPQPLTPTLTSEGEYNYEGGQAQLSSSPGTGSGDKVLVEEPQRYHKDFRTRQLIRAALGENDFLQNLDREQIKDIVDFMYQQTIAPGEFVIREGEPGSHLYVSAEGTFYVSQDSRNLGTLKPGVAFGELALLYNCKRTASIRAMGECKVWALERKAFRVAMVKAGMQRIKDRLMFLKSVPLLKSLDPVSLGRIADCLEVEKYPQGSFIIREGAAGDNFFIISEGRVQVTTSSGDPSTNTNQKGTEIPVPLLQVENYEDKGVMSPGGVVSPCQILRELGHGDYFGEQALLREERRSANVIAITDVEVLTLDRESFIQLIGNLTEFHLSYLREGRNKAQSSSCLELNLSDSSTSTLSFSGKSFPTPIANRERERESERERPSPGGHGKLSCSLPNPPLERDKYLLGIKGDFDYSKLRLDDLEFVSTLGVGGFGRVELVQISYDPNRVYALKCLPKAHVFATQQQEHVFSERNIMLACNSPFIARMYRTFKDSKYVYMLMEACLGGEVWTCLRNKGSFDEGTTRFIAACVILALEYLHDRNIIYRDLKPENLMLANDGYVKLVDFGFSKIVPPTSKTWTFCGTPEYCAPEVILNKGHDHTVDFWAFGILLFELLTGCPPWGPMAETLTGSASSRDSSSEASQDPLTTYHSILKGIEAVPFNAKAVSKAGISLIRRLCRQVPGERLGARNFREITSHRWWQGFDWEGLRFRSMKPPIRPNLRGPSDTQNFDKFELEVEEVVDDFSGWDADF